MFYFIAYDSIEEKWSLKKAMSAISAMSGCTSYATPFNYSSLY